MCGVAGFVEFRSGYSDEEYSATIKKMTDRLRHRGPDDSGLWVDSGRGIALGHRRLSIIDTSSAGHQPMSSSGGRYTVAYNGEIYNFRQIRRDLESRGHRFRGHSDTEVMLAAFEQWGIDDAVSRFVGMFAFAVWDSREQSVILARDRLGEKPLYYAWTDTAFLFGSEIKALQGHHSWRGEIDRDSLTLLLRHNYIPAPYSVYRDVFKLLPGCLLTVRAGAWREAEFSPWPREGSGAAPRPYWSMSRTVLDAQRNCYRGTAGEAIEELDGLLKDAVSGQMISDVPLGALLSGGIDSSTIVSVMQAVSSRPVKTFSIGFRESEYDEAGFARDVAAHLGTDHTELYVTPKDALDVIPDLAQIYDEPFADSSQIPTCLVSRLAQREVTVCLSGDGGDELFGGYDRYGWASSIWRSIGWMPGPVRGLAGQLLRGPSQGAWDRLLNALRPMLGARLPRENLGSKVYRLADMLTEPDFRRLYRLLISHWQAPSDLVIGGQEPFTQFDAREVNGGLYQQMMYLDSVTYLPDDILAKVDRAAMATGLEVRVPLLDHRIVEFAWRLPLSFKVNGKQAKWLLRQVLYKYVPREMVDRPKMGFGVPIGQWLRGPLRDWAEDLLSEARLRNEGYFDPDPIRRKWNEHLSGAVNWQYPLWDILMFQSWLQKAHRA